MITIRNERPADESAREALLDAAYGSIRHSKPSARLRKGRAADGVALVAAEKGRIVGTVRSWTVEAGACRALLLGPLAVNPDCRKRGIGSALMRRALADAARRGHSAIVLVGDPAFYARFGFTVEKAAKLRLAGLADSSRLLGLELIPGALSGAQGWLTAAGSRTTRLGALKRLVRPAGRLVTRAA